ncbi:hypothetical protein Bca52824_089715 [Brassica carinata]|uniref:Uncharacterized protein n=1 Tax=Brassica carinata TaxID=52824 RepID=A0A8X7PFP5_BRACI|nr:hypothetical protein Bca52824_089715 [Brassica carinata]
MTTETGRKKRTPQILKTDTSHTALKLAEKWVANMTTPAEDEPEQEVRTRLILGVKVSRQVKRRPSDDPLDQKLQAKFDAGRKHARTDAQSASASKNAGDDTEDDDDESESKSQAFGKKRHNTIRRR